MLSKDMRKLLKERKGKIDILKRSCCCNYCKMCSKTKNWFIDYFQVYLNDKPIIAGLTYKDAVGELERYFKLGILNKII